MMGQIRCNHCGRLIQVQGENRREDCLKVEKEWGYFSEKDRELHEFYLCEQCYDAWVREFQIPVTVRTVEEVL